MTMTAPARPVFQNGQRLTAERLTDAFEFLRTMLRRVLLAPLSSGVAAGFELLPPINEPGSVLVIEPGLAIDGRGRLIIVPDQLQFTAQQIVAAVGGVAPSDAQAVRICLFLDDASQSNDPCAPQLPGTVVEGFKVRFIVEDALTAFAQIFAQFEEPNCVNAWDKLDGPEPSNEDCCVTLGHLKFTSSSAFTSSTFFRKGVSPRFNVIRNTNGIPSIFLADLRFDPTPFGIAMDPLQDIAAVGIPLPTVFGPGQLFVNGPMASSGGATFTGRTGGTNLQATEVSPFNTPYKTATTWQGDGRVFVASGGGGIQNGDGTSEVPAAGVVSVACQVLPSSFGNAFKAGLPLELLEDLAGKPGVVRTSSSGPRLIGLSAGPEQSLGGRQVVPVATSGILKATVSHPTTFLQRGDPLTVLDENRLKIAGVGDLVVAISGTTMLTNADTDAFVWVVHPPQLKTL